MACPVHIWAPLMAAALPFAAAARTRLDATMARRRQRRAPSPPPRSEVHRWAPIAPGAGVAVEEERPEP